MTREPVPADIAVGLRIRLRRKTVGLSQQDLAERIGVTFQQVQKYEKGSNRVGASRLAATAEALGVPVSYFFPEPANDGDGLEHTDALQLARLPGATELLLAYAQIADPKVRRAVLTLVRNLAAAAGAQTAESSEPQGG